MIHQISAPEPGTSRPWWLEAEFGWLLILVIGAYFLRSADLPIQGEEPTRAQIAMEMVASGDWIVPRQQGEPFVTRPPLQNWLIAGSCLLFCSWDAWAIRFHALVAVLLTTLLIYGYSRLFLTRLGAFAAAAAFATMGHMFTKGSQAETDALFIFFISGSLLVWHWGIVRGWSDVVTFSCGYGLMALGSLTKGMQAPAYFVGAIVLHLVLTQQWSRLFSRGHAIGILVAAALHLAWIIPYCLAIGWSHALDGWFADVAMAHNSDVETWELSATLLHWLTYPFAVLAATLPWSLFLLPFLFQEFRNRIGAARPLTVFAGICVAVALPTCWIPAGGLVRYFAPLYPSLAVLIGLAIQRCAETDAPAALQAAWRRFLTCGACAIVLAALALVAAAGYRMYDTTAARWAETPLGAVLFGGAFLGLAIVLVRNRASFDAARVRAAIVAIAVCMTLGFAGTYTNARVRLSEFPADDVQRVKEKLPPGQALVSLGGRFDCLFCYYFGSPLIKNQPWEAAATDPDLNYFCFMRLGNRRKELPFAWEEIAAVSMDRKHRDDPERVVVVGRKVR